jgi:deazaflavin-dependent oxidoreductase (nitroreductase family)
VAKPYRVTAFVRINNAVTASLIRLGVRIGTFTLLTVRGRKSGRPIDTPVALFLHEGQRYLIATYGEVNWVRNLRAAGGVAALTQGRRSEAIRAVELALEDAASIFQAALRSGPPGIPAPMVRVYRRYFVLPYLDVTLDSPFEDVLREVRTHPVFLVRSAQPR